MTDDAAVRSVVTLNVTRFVPIDVVEVRVQGSRWLPWPAARNPVLVNPAHIVMLTIDPEAGGTTRFVMGDGQYRVAMAMADLVARLTEEP